MEINPKPFVVKKLKEMAAKEGISLNALLMPYFNAIAEGRLVLAPTFTPAGQQPQEERRVG